MTPDLSMLALAGQRVQGRSRHTSCEPQTGQVNLMKIERVWCMPNSDTLSVPEIGGWVKERARGVIVDPFARDSLVGTYRNDLDPNTKAEYHMDALDFAEHLRAKGVVADTVVFDPPYSPRQLSECYTALGRSVTAADTQNPGRWTELKAALIGLVRPGGIVLSFGWNSCGFGTKHGCEMASILLVCHGAGHNDTICVEECMVQHRMFR